MFSNKLLKTIFYTSFAGLFLAGTGFAQDRLSVSGSQQTTQESNEDSLLRLPGSGGLKQDNEVAQLQTGDKLVPGGGLLMSFDRNGDGLIDTMELEYGITEAFKAADANNSGDLTPLEQIRWAENLPTYDASLANPVRFDPNLNRRVSASEFTAVIRQLANGLSDEETGQLLVASLKRAD